ncbi:MAG: ankyrin repeat domain-containing protein [Tatlockia sp.]|nr:ankyrin repeat domain-containing protein [Tatlockia sp.]
MQRISGPYTDQKWFIKRMNQLFANVSEDGVCFGIAAMKMQAIFSGDSDLFDKRTKIMHDIPSKKFKEELEDINKIRLEIIKTVKKEIKPLRELNDSEKKELLADEYLNIALLKLEEAVDKLVKENQIPLEKKNEELSRRRELCYFNAFIQNKINQKIDQLSEEDRIKLDIPIFLNGVQIYQQDSLYPYLYENGESPTTDRILCNYPLASSKYFENKEGISKLRQFSGIYTVEELTNYFSSFARISKPNKALSPLVFILHNIDHAITIGYDPQKGEWSFTNASFLPSGYTCDPQELANEVHKAFSDNNVAIFSSEIFTEKQVEKEWEETLSTWEKDDKLIEMRTVTPEKTQRTDSKNQALLSLAAAQGDLALVEQVIEAEKKIPKEQRLRHVRCPALCMAVQNKNYNVVKRLLENGEDPNQTRQDDNVSPLLLAASQGDYSTIRLLLENGSDPNMGTKDNFTSLHISVLKDDLKTAKLILDALTQSKR